MEAAVRLVQGGGPNGQRIDGAGGGQQAQQQQNALTHQVRTVPPPGVPPGVSQVRPIDMQPAYASKLQAPMQQKVSRSSPLSPPRTVATTYSCYPGTVVRDPGARYPQQMPYRQVGHFRETPYKLAHVHQMDYHRLVPNVSGATNSMMVGGGSGVPAMHEATPPGAVEGRQRISLLPYGAGSFMPSGQTRQLPEHELDGQPGIKRILSMADGPVMMKMDDQEPPPGVYQTRIKNICVDDMTGQLKMEEPTYEPRIKKMCVDEGASGILKIDDDAAAASGPYQQGIKRIRLGDAPGMLKIEVPDAPPAAGAYHPQVEAISPTLPGDTAEELRATKDDLLQQISKVDSEIGKVEKSIELLKKKEASLQEASAKPPATEETSEVPPKHRSLAQKIYAENKRKASMAHAMLAKMGPPVDLPLYNQPSDVEACREIMQRNVAFKPRLLLHCQKIKSEKSARSVAFAECYFQKSQEWLRRVEKNEASAKRKTKEAKNREFFEKVFPELRKQREDKERFNRVGSRIKSEADLEEIMDGLQEQAMEDKKMRSYAVIPPLMLDTHQKKYYFINENGAMMDMEADFKDRQHLNLWTSGEKEMFKEKFLQHPKNFGAIAVSLDRKSAQDCVRYYYLSKKTDNYKQLLRKARQRTRSSKNPQKSTINQSQCIIDALTTGVTTRLQREQQQKIGGRDRTTATSTASNQSSGTGNSAAGSGTVTPVTVATATATSTTSTTLSAQSVSSQQTQEVVVAADAAEQVTNHVENEPTETLSGFTRKDDAPSEVQTTEQTTNDFGAIDSISVPLHQMESQTNKDPSIALERTSKDDSTEIIAVDKDVLQFCFVCKATLCSRSRPLEKSRCKQYGIPESNLVTGARICNTCQCKSLRRYSSCPLPTCPNAKDRVKRFRNLPTRLFDLAPDLRDAIVAEFQIPPGVQKCCSACLIRIRRKLAPHIQTTPFTEDEIVRLKGALADWGHNWQKLEEIMGKPQASVRMFYVVNRKKCGLDEAVGEYYKKNPGEVREIHGEISDVDESDFSTSSCDEREANSDTASAESPPTNAAPAAPAPIVKEIEVVPKKVEEERVVAPEPAKRHSMKSIEECDSSATETADEENELSPANRQSPKVLIYPNQTTITMLPFSGQNGPREVSSPPQNVRDVVLNVIERSLKTSGPQLGTPAKLIKPPFAMEQRPEISYMRDVKEPPHPSDTLATISVLNSQNRTLMGAQQQQGGVAQAGQFAATITPVPLAKGGDKEPMKMYTQIRTEPEPQTLDLSVKKSQVREVTSKNPQQQPQMANNVVAMLRTEGGQTQMSLPQQTVSPNHLYQSHQAYHQQQAQGGRSAKSPSVFVPISVGQQQLYHQVPATRATPVTSSTMMKSKMSPKPQMQQPPPPPSNPTSGPKGSITHGTPVSQPATFLLQAPPSASPRFDTAPQPANEKIGSITQGTPVHMPPHHLNEKHRVYEYYKNSRQSPAQPQSSPQSNFGPAYGRTFGMDQQQLSSRQIIVNDFFTSQQMHGQARGVRSNQPTPEKDSHSPRNVAATINASNVAMYYDKERQRSEYMSRSSPADNANSLNRSLKTPPPPQRQGVIQRHNTGGSKPSSPAPNRLHVMQHHYPPPPGERMVSKERDRALAGATLAGHEAFSSLVDVAVQQPLLPVPQDKRPPPFQGNPASHHDIRLHHMAFQLHQQHQFQQMQQLDMKLESQKRHSQHMPGSTFDELQFERERREEHFAAAARDGHPPSHDLLERHAQLERDLHADHERLMERDAMLASASEERAAMHSAEMEKAAAAEHEQQRRLAIAQPQYEPPKVTARQILDRDRERSERSLMPPRSTDGTLTAANLIDAIITHQINQSASDPPPVSVSRALHKSGFFYWT
uniref:Putative histone H3-k4 methylation n=1 Tax=Nyssomyia neivai TaxID=330878 RepID=A0A1L8DXF1_9DIPT